MVFSTTRNPFYKAVKKAESSESAASYGGIVAKCAWFWVLCFAGVAAYFFLPKGIISGPTLIALVIAALFCPFLTYWFPSLTPVTGSIYSVLQGFAVAFICTQYAKEYAGLVYIAVGITALVFFIVLFLYSSGMIKLNQKFRGVVLALFLASIAGSVIFFISSFFTTALTSVFLGNGPIAIIVSVISLLFSVLNLIFEFDFATRLVKNRLHKKYEWTTAFGLFMTVIIIFLKVFELLAMLIDKKESR